MKQLSFSQIEYKSQHKKTRRHIFLKEMDEIIPWGYLCEILKPYYYGDNSGLGRKPYPLELILRVYFMQNWFALSDPGMEDALRDSAAMRDFVGFSSYHDPVPDETTILNFRHLLEKDQLTEHLFKKVNEVLEQQGLRISSGTIVDATIISSPSSTKNKDNARDPEMKHTRKGNQFYFGMKAHIGVDKDSGMIHSAVCTPANVNDVTQAHALLDGKETCVFGDAGYQGVENREGCADVIWITAQRPGRLRLLDPDTNVGKLARELEHAKASIRAKVEHSFRVIKQQFKYQKTRYRGIYKNSCQIYTLLMLANLWMFRRKLAPI